MAHATSIQLLLVAACKCASIVNSPQSHYSILLTSFLEAEGGVGFIVGVGFGVGEIVDGNLTEQR